MTRLPLPEPDGWAGKDYYHRPATTLSDIIFAPEQARYTADQMHAYSDAENATLTEQVRVLREALEYVLLDEPTGIPRASSACRRVVALALLELIK